MVTKLGLSDPEANICSVVYVYVCVCGGGDRDRDEAERHGTTDRDTFQCWSGTITSPSRTVEGVFHGKHS